MKALYTRNQIRLFSGQFVNPLELQPKEVQLVDIAHGLAHRCRFAGHTLRFYSVAEHSLRVAQLVPEEHRLQALLHDASEAYLFDIPSPIKHCFPELQSLEDRIMHAIAQKFCFTWPVHDVVKNADRIALEEEWHERVLNHMWKVRKPEHVKREFRYAVLKELRKAPIL